MRERCRRIVYSISALSSLPSPRSQSHLFLSRSYPHLYHSSTRDFFPAAFLCPRVSNCAELPSRLIIASSPHPKKQHHNHGSNLIPSQARPRPSSQESYRWRDHYPDQEHHCERRRHQTSSRPSCAQRDSTQRKANRYFCWLQIIQHSPP